MTLSPTTKWTLILIAVGFAGAALFYSPYLGVNAQMGLECPLCPHVTSSEDPHDKFIRYTLVGGLLNSIMFLFIGANVRAIIVGRQKLRTYWS